MSILKKPYEIYIKNVMKQVTNDPDDGEAQQQLEAQEEAEQGGNGTKNQSVESIQIGSHLPMEELIKEESGQGYAFEPILSRNVNGVKKFSFKMHTQYFDVITGKKVNNPFIKYLINEREIQLKYAEKREGDAWQYKFHDFVIKNISENSKTHINTYQLEDAYVSELAKNGFNVTLDEKFGNNVGTLKELADYVIETIGERSDSNDKADSGEEAGAELLSNEETSEGTSSGVQWKVEAEQVDDWVNDMLVGNNIPYGSCVGKPFAFQTGTVSEKEDVDGFRTLSNDKIEFFTPDQYAESNGLFFPKDTSYNGSLTTTRIKRKNYVHKAKYIPILDKYVNLYEDVDGVLYYGYSEPKFKSPIFIKNLITNPNFEGESGWTGALLSGTEVAEDPSTSTTRKPVVKAVYGRFKDGGFVNAEEDLITGNWPKTEEDRLTAYNPYLQITVPPGGGILVNSGPRDNRDNMSNVVEGKEWRLAYEFVDKFEPEILIGEYSYNSEADSYQLDKEGIVLGKNSLGYWNWVKAIGDDEKYSDEEFKKKSNIRILFKLPNDTNEDKTYYLKSATFHEVVYLNKKKNEIILPDKQGEKVEDNQIVERTYKYYLASEVKVAKKAEDLKPVYSTGILSYEDFVPVTNDGQKIRSINVKESNYFNILQTLAETFGVWLVINVSHDDNGTVTEKKIQFKNYIDTENPATFEYGKNLQEIQRVYESKNIVSKLIVKQNSNQYGENGFCTIARAKSNPTGDNFIYDFRYFHDSKLLDPQAFLAEYEGKGYFPKVSKLNRELRELNEKYALKSGELTEYKAKYELASAGFEAAVSGIEEMSTAFYNATGFSISELPVKIDTIEITAENLEFEDYGLEPKPTASISPSGVSSYDTSWNGTITVETNELADMPGHTFYVHAYPKIKFNNDKEITREYVIPVIVEADKNEGTATFTIDPLDVGRSGNARQCVREYAEFTRQKDHYQAEVKDLLGKITATEKELQTMKTGANGIDTLQNGKEALDKAFFTKYSRYIHEGTWINEECVDDEKYYSDALSVLFNSSYPKVVYSINVVNLEVLSQLKNGLDEDAPESGYSFKVGDTTKVIDKEFFGEKESVSVVVTELIENLDNPSINTIKVQNFKDQFQDLFQKITATVQETKYSTGSYRKAVALAEANQAKKQAFLTDAMDAASARLTTAGQQSVIWGNDGITVRSVDSPCDAIRMVGGAILLSKQDKNGEQKWVTGVTSDGITASLITAGVLNAGEISIMNYDEPAFRWDAFGLTAFDAKWTNNEFGTSIEDINSRKFIRFDKFGLYGINNAQNIDGLSWYPGKNIPKDDKDYKPEKDIDKNATFALTWEGLKVKNVKGVSLRIGDLAKTSQASSNILDVRDPNGNMTIAITEDGALIWGDGDFITRALYKVEIENFEDKPMGGKGWDEYPESDVDSDNDEIVTPLEYTWHKVKEPEDYWVSYSYDGCKTWSDPIQIQARDVVDGYIESSRGTFFEEGSVKDTDETELVAKIFKGEYEIDPNGDLLTYQWYLNNKTLRIIKSTGELTTEEKPVEEGAEEPVPVRGKSVTLRIKYLLDNVVTFVATSQKTETTVEEEKE